MRETPFFFFFFGHEIILKLWLFIIVDVRARIRKADMIDIDEIRSYCLWLSIEGSPARGVFLNI